MPPTPGTEGPRSRVRAAHAVRADGLRRYGRYLGLAISRAIVLAHVGRIWSRELPELAPLWCSSFLSRSATRHARSAEPRGSSMTADGPRRLRATDPPEAGVAGNDGRILALVSREAWLAGPAQAPVAGLQPRGGWRSRWHRSSSQVGRLDHLTPGRGRAPPRRPRTRRASGLIRSPSSCRLPRTRLLGGGSVRCVDRCQAKFTKAVLGDSSRTGDRQRSTSRRKIVRCRTHPKALKLPAGRQPTPGRPFRAPQSVF